MNDLKSKYGFTLLELLLSIALITIVFAISIPIYGSFQTRNDLDITATNLAKTLRRAIMLSQGVDGDESWGVHVDTGSITLFRGSSFATREGGLDEVFDVPESTTFSGVTEVVFTKFTGEPQTTGTFTITAKNNEVREISINEKGRIDY